MRKRLSFSLTFGLACCLFLSPAEAKKQKPTPCPGGRYLVEGDRLIGAGMLPADAVVLAGGMLSVDSGCPPVKAKVKARKKFTQVSARWRSCTGITGPASFKAKIGAGICDTVKGSFKAKKAKINRRLTARLPQPPAFTTGPFTPVPLSQATVGPEGATITVTDPASPLAALVLVVPPRATNEPITFEITYSDVTASGGLPAGVVTGRRLIRISASGSAAWNEFRIFNRLVRVTLPYDPPPEGENETFRYYVVNGDGTLEAAGLEGIDLQNHTITFYTSVFGDTAQPAQLAAISPQEETGERLFSDYVSEGFHTQLASALLFGAAATVDSGFRPSVNGWYIPNYGSYYKGSRGGSCFGFVGSAKHYYRKRYTPALYGNYHDPDNTTTWVDDKVAIEYTARVHNAMAEMWGDEFATGEVNFQEPSSRQVALSIVGGLYVTGNPAILYIQQAIPQADGSTAYTGAHAIAAYSAEVTGSTIVFHLYDPNKNGKDDPKVGYTFGGTFSSYLSGTTAADSTYSYNFFKHVGFQVALSDALIDRIKAAADRGFQGSTEFPTVTITSVTGGSGGAAATEGTTPEGEHKFITSDATVRIQGTIAGGLAQNPCCVVTTAQVFVSNRHYAMAVNATTGAFDTTVPVAQGENDFVILGADNRYFFWAGFYRNVIESTASTAALTITLSWDEDKSDVDLYVKEPDGPGGKIGDTVYYGNRRAAAGVNPYLDLDDTTGLGPEHYIANALNKTHYTDGTDATGLYGDYTAKVHYYADHDDDLDNTQPIIWGLDWRYLAFCPAPCNDPDNDGFWQEGSESGVIVAANSANCCDIGHTGPDWSAAVPIKYPVPDPSAWAIPDPPAVMLP